jgi:hypothetical protein
MSIMRLVTTTHLGRGDLGMSCGYLLQDVNTFSYCMQHCSCSVKHMGTSWGIGGDVCLIYVCVFLHVR